MLKNINGKIFEKYVLKNSKHFAVKILILKNTKNLVLK